MPGAALCPPRLQPRRSLADWVDDYNREPSERELAPLRPVAETENSPQVKVWCSGGRTAAKRLTARPSPARPSAALTTTCAQAGARTSCRTNGLSARSPRSASAHTSMSSIRSIVARAVARPSGVSQPWPPHRQALDASVSLHYLRVDDSWQLGDASQGQRPNECFRLAAANHAMCAWRERRGRGHLIGASRPTRAKSGGRSRD
jgi:hypothetical protein